MNIRELLFVDRPLVVNPKLAVEIGLNEAIVLQQISYWLKVSKHERDGKAWVYKTYDEWGEEFPFWSISTIRRAISSLEKLGIVLSTSEYNKMKIDNTKWYTIDYLPEPVSRPSVQDEQTHLSNMNRPSAQDEQTHLFKMNRPITIDYTETTPEITSETTNAGRQANTTAILTDSFVQDNDYNTLSRSLVQEFKTLDPEFVMRHVFEWKQALSDGKANNIGGLAKRLRSDSWNPKPLTDDQRRTKFYIRHFGKYDFEAAARAERNEYAAWKEAA